MTPSDVIDLNRPMATGRFMPPALVQEKAGLVQGLPGSRAYFRAHCTSSTRAPSPGALFPVVEEERITTNRHNEHLSFLLGDIAELKTPRPGLFSSLKRMIARPAVTTSTQPPSCVTSSNTHKSVPPIPVPLEESPLFKAPAPIATSAPPCDDAAQPNTTEFLAYQGLHLQLRMAMSNTCIAKSAVISPPKPTEPSPQLFSTRLSPSNHAFNSSTSLVTPAMKNLFVEAVSEVATEADSNAIPLTPVLSPLQRAVAQARAAGYHLHKPVPLAPPTPSATPPRSSCSVETQDVLHGDGLRRLVLCKNASTYPIPGKETNKSPSNANADYELCLKRIGRGVGDDWVQRFRVMPSTVYLDVRLWDPKRSEDNKIEVQLGKPLLRSSPLKRVLKNSIRRDSIELEESHHIPRRLRNVRSKIHRRRVVVEIPAKEAKESTPSLASVTRERRRDRIRNSVRAKRKDMSEGTSEAIDKVRRWSDEWKRLARLMAVPKPGIETTRSEQAPEARAASTISTATAKSYRSGWAKPRLHVTSHHGYLEEDTSDEELMEHDDEADIAGDLCHTGCEPVFVSLPSPVDTSPSSKFPNDARPAVKAEQERQPKVPVAMDIGKHSRTPLSRVHSLKAF